MSRSTAMSRRQVLTASGAMALVGVTGAGKASAEPAQARSQPTSAVPDKRRTLKKALLYGMLPSSFSVLDRFKLVADLGFDGVEVTTPSDDQLAETLRSAADRAGVRIHSVMNSESWNYPLSSGDPEVVAKGREILRRSLAHARTLGADTVLLIPAVVTPEVRYKDAWERSQREIRRVLPLAQELGIAIAIENVGNRFLLSPLEFTRYVDEIANPYLQAYFDVGNSLMLWGYPQDWILTLGRRIRKIHLKDCDFGKKKFVRLRDGDVDWPAVRRAVSQASFNGFVTVEPNYRSPELDRGDRAYLEEIARRVDLILSGR